MARDTSTGPSEVPRWVLAANAWIEGAILVVLGSLMWWLLTLLGLVVAGIGPASCALDAALVDARRHRRVRVVRDMWRTYRTVFGSAATRISPLQLAAVLAVATVLLGMSGGVPARWMMVPVAALGAFTAAWLSVAAAAITAVPRLRRQDVLVGWRVALLAPGAVPASAIAFILGTAIVAGVSLVVPPLGFLAAPAAIAGLARTFVAPRLGALLDAASDAGADGPAEHAAVPPEGRRRSATGRPRL